jgi:beta-D-xylosidase 4
VRAQVNPCIDSTSPQAKLPWCDPKLPIDKRVKDMVGRIPLKEKLPLLDTGGSPVPSLGLSSYNWWSEASTGVASGRNTQTTKFAFPITTGMSFNRTLWKLTGAQIGREARAMMNAGNGFSTFWAPVINLGKLKRKCRALIPCTATDFAELSARCLARAAVAREPRWGRNIETPGE